MTSFRKLSVVSTVATLALITLGAVVRSTDSGLGCSDHWPGCNGSVIPDFTNHHVVIEFSHRFVALIVMVLIGSMMVRAYRNRSDLPHLFTPSAAAFFLVLFQAGLGAVVVKL
jgi:cytochrome c oxidase assembly protein subunit 15